MPVCLTLHIPLFAHSLVLFDLFVNIVAHNLAEPAYEADVAQLEYKLVAEEHGLVIKVKGFNHKLEVCRVQSEFHWLHCLFNHKLFLTQLQFLILSTNSQVKGITIWYFSYNIVCVNVLVTLALVIGLRKFALAEFANRYPKIWDYEKNLETWSLKVEWCERFHRFENWQTMQQGLL